MLKSLKTLPLTLACLFLLSACGQKGPLMLPEKKADMTPVAHTEVKSKPATAN